MQAANLCQAGHAWDVGDGKGDDATAQNLFERPKNIFGPLGADKDEPCRVNQPDHTVWVQRIGHPRRGDPNNRPLGLGNHQQRKKMPRAAAAFM